MLNAAVDNQELPRVNYFIIFPAGVRFFKVSVGKFWVDVRVCDGEWYPVGSQSLLVYNLKPKETSKENHNPKIDRRGSRWIVFLSNSAKMKHLINRAGV